MITVQRPRYNAITRRAHRLLLPLLLVVLAGCRSGDEAARPPLRVATAAVELEPFADRIEAIATLDAEQIVQLASQVTGRVTQLKVRQGQLVRPGDVVLVLDQAQLQAELASLRAQMRTDQINYERYEKLVREGAASAIQRDQFRQTALASRQALAARQADLAYRIVRAPQAGLIGELNLKPGDVVQAGVPFTQLVSNQALNAEIELPANRAASVRVGLPVILHPSGPDVAALNTRITALEPAVNPATQLLMAQAPVGQASSRWRSGMRLRAEVVLSTRQQLSVPASAVTRLAGQSFVFVVGTRAELVRNPGRVDRKRLNRLPAQSRFALQVPVQLGPLENNRYPVLSGLSPGQQVITSGLLMLRHGMPVQAS
ncbi:MAG: efflux RND transporter periplasmic adaptor subunit [Prochlorococcaceae cyanobacterium]